MPTQREMIEQLQRGKVSLSPLSFGLLKDKPVGRPDLRPDAWVEASWGENTARFAVECRAISTPRAFQDSLNRLRSTPLPEGYWPMLLTSFLNEKQLQQLEEEGISGIDMCGNGVVVVPGKFSVSHTGEKNRYPSSAPIKNIYRRNSSMVGRVFLLRHSYSTVQEILTETNRRNMLVNRWDKKAMSLSTVSKSL